MSLFARRQPNVEKLRRKGDIAGLRKASRFQDIQTDAEGELWDLGVPIRLDAVRSIAGFYGPAVGKCLTEALDDPHFAVRLAAVEGIGELGVPLAVEELLDCVVRWGDPPDDLVAKASLDALGSWRVEGLAERFADGVTAAGGAAPNSHHRDALQGLLAGDPRGTLAAATAVAMRMVASLSTVTDSARQTCAEAVLTWVAPHAPDVLLAAFIAGNATPAVARASAFIRDPRAVAPLVRFLRDGDEELRRSAAIGLEGLRDTRAVPALVVATQDPEQSVREASAAALNSMGMAAVIVGLGTLMRNGDPELQPGDEPLVALPHDTGWAGEVVTRLLSRGE